jgi:OOP family OmpA-OmpF porin
VTVAQATASVNVTPATSSLTAAGATAQLSAQATDANNRPITGKMFAWASDKTTTATVSAAGLVTAVADGVAHVSATVDGKSGSAIVTVVVPARGAPPVELPALPAVNATKVIANMTFRTVRGRPELTPAAQSDLDKLAIAIQGMPNSRWEIGGYTSNVGTPAALTQRSQRQADAVRAYLVTKGVPTASITAKGYGPANPIGNNRTAAGRAQNNRVEIKRLQ